MLDNLEEIEGLTPEQIEAINKKATGLSSKNSELLNKLSKKKEVSQSAEAEIEALRQFKQESELSAAKSAEDWEKVKALTLENHQIELQRVAGESQADKQLIKTLLIDNGLSSALDLVEINPALKEGAISLFQNQCVISDGQAMLGDKSLSEAIKEWSETATGKAFTLAPNNSGGDSGGGTKAPANKPFAEWSITEKTRLANTNPTEYQRLTTGN